MDTSYRSRFMLQRRLAERSYTCDEFILDDKGFMKFIAPADTGGKVWLTRAVRLSYPFVSVAAEYIAKNKQLAYTFADKLGVRIPATLHIPADNDKLEKIFEQYEKVVVKPIDSYSSHGMSLDVSDAESLKRAIANAQQYNHEVLVQEQCSGQEIRFTVVNGKVVHCLLRETPRVIGDGVSSVKQLIESENEARKNLGFEIVPYPPLDDSMIPAGVLTSEEVLPADTLLELNRSTLIAGGASMLEVTGDVHDTYKAAAEKLASELNPEFLVIDFLIDDYRQQLSKDNYVFLELNTAPSLRLYYDVRSGSDYDIVGTLADMIDNGGHEHDR